MHEHAKADCMKLALPALILKYLHDKYCVFGFVPPSNP
jgi:hypothetical protein